MIHNLKEHSEFNKKCSHQSNDGDLGVLRFWTFWSHFASLCVNVLQPIKYQVVRNNFHPCTWLSLQKFPTLAGCMQGRREPRRQRARQKLISWPHECDSRARQHWPVTQQSAVESCTDRNPDSSFWVLTPSSCAAIVVIRIFLANSGHCL